MIISPVVDLRLNNAQIKGVESEDLALRKQSEETTSAKSWAGSGKYAAFTIACPDLCIARTWRERV
jgi:hypothetical protein